MINFKNVTYNYPFQEMAAVKDISFEVQRGEVLLITGESGCGKSTVAKIANGLIPHYFKGELCGVVEVDGVDNRSSSIAEISGRIGTLFQDPEQQFFCPDVYSELSFAHEVRGTELHEIRKTVDSYAAIFEIKNILKSSIFSLSEGEKQKVALASILSLNPKTVVLDEPTANLSPEATTSLGAQVMKLKEAGFAVMIVDHRLYWLEGIADRVIVMKNGRICEEGSFGLLRKSQTRDKYGLRRDCVVRESKYESSSKEGLHIKNLTFAYKGKSEIFKDYSLRFQNGKITALCGSNGAGKTTLSRLITGLLKAKKGDFYLHGKKHPSHNLLKRTSLVLQNVDHQLYARTVLDEVCGQKELLELFQLGQLSDRHPQSLSGGQKQRLVIAAAISKNPDIIILDEPTSGLDGRNMKRIGTILKEEANKNKVVIVITHDLEFMNECCDCSVELQKGGILCAEQ